MNFIQILLLGIFMSGCSSDGWVEFVTVSHKYLSERQEELKRDFQLGKHSRYDWDQDTGSLVFSNDGVPAVIAKVQFVGSISTTSSTWLWSWANDTVQDNVKDKMHIVNEYGQSHNYSSLVTDKWPADEVDGWEMTSIAAYLLNAKGAYRTSKEGGFTYMVITDISWAN